jgi:mannosidase alpha-like ER degradation enhancer 1
MIRNKFADAFLLVGQYHVRPGHLVYVNDSTIFASQTDPTHIAQEEIRRRDAELHLRIFTASVDPMLQVQSSAINNTTLASIVGYAAHFGADLSSSVILDPTEPTPRIRDANGVAVRREPDNKHGCDPYDHQYQDSMLLVHRGHCTFLEKLLQARDALAAGIIIISDEETGINPTANIEELAGVGDLSDVGVILLPKKTGETFEEMILVSEKSSTLQIMVALQRELDDFGDSESSPKHGDEAEEEQTKDPNRILYINGHPLMNTRLLI